MKVIIFFGGPSSERDISAGSIKPWVTYLQADPAVELTVIFLDRKTQPFILPPCYYYSNTCADFESQLNGSGASLTWLEVESLATGADVVVPLVHGEFGEDGQLQESLESWGVPYVFSRPEALAVTLDKQACAAKLEEAGFPAPANMRIDFVDWTDDRDKVLSRLEGMTAHLGGEIETLVIKPLTGGSSFGVFQTEKNDPHLADQIDRAFEGSKEPLIAEELIAGQEFSVVVLQCSDGTPVALAPTEIEKPDAQMIYGTAQKYLHGSGVIHHTPYRSGEKLILRIRNMAQDAFKTLGLRHMARLDGFILEDGTVLITDVNGIGGMGFSSFVFQQAAMVGFDHRTLIFWLIDLAISGDQVPSGRVPAATLQSGTVTAQQRDSKSTISNYGGSMRVHVILGGPTSERQVSRQSGCFVGLSLLASGFDVHFYLMDLSCRYSEIGLFYVLHHDVEEIQALLGDPQRRSEINSVADSIAGVFSDVTGGIGGNLFAGPTTDLDAATEEADFVFLALHGGPGEDGTLQLALENLGRPHNGSGPEASLLASDKINTAKAITELEIAGLAAPNQLGVPLIEMGSWLKELSGDGQWQQHFDRLCSQLGSSKLVCKPATDGCSTGVKVLSDGDEMRRYLEAIVDAKPRFATGEMRDDIRGEELVITLPVPSPKVWLIEQALTEEKKVRLPDGDQNLSNLNAWFAEKRFVELTCAVLDLAGNGLVAAVPSVTVAAQELTLQQKFEQGVGTNIELSQFASKDTVDWIREKVLSLCHSLGIEGYGRVDLFWDKTEELLYLLEINTLCGLTEATVFYSQWLAADEPLAPWAALRNIVDSGLERARNAHSSREKPSSGASAW